MKNSDTAYDTSYGFEIPRDIREKILSTERSQNHISESEPLDFRYVDVSRNPYCKVKRILDVLFSFIGIFMLLIPMAIIALIIYADNAGCALFTQYRIGLGGKKFKAYKFRTMRMETPKNLSKSKLNNPEKYILRSGRYLRKCSIDEIPQLLNVIKGDMSLVGPRPLITDEIEIHKQRMKYGVYNIRPGITGLAQINGRDALTATEKVRWDIKYLENFGFFLDLKVMLLTLPKILTDKNAK